MAFGGLIALGNWLTPFVSHRTGRNVSMVPLFGGILLAIGIYAVTKSVRWALLGFALDIGSIVCVISLPMLAHELWSTSRFVRIHILNCHDSGRDITVELYHRNQASISFTFDKIVARKHFDDCPLEIGFSAQWTTIDEGFEIFDYADGRRMMLTQLGETYLASESSIPNNTRLSTHLDGLQFVILRDAYKKGR